MGCLLSTQTVLGVLSEHYLQSFHVNSLRSWGKPRVYKGFVLLNEQARSRGEGS